MFFEMGKVTLTSVSANTSELAPIASSKATRIPSINVSFLIVFSFIT
jgi:hypothetical protein